MANLTLPQAVLYLNAIPQFVQIEYGSARIYMNEAFAGVQKGKQPTKAPSFWLSPHDITPKEWAERAAQRGDKHPLNEE